LALEDAWFTTSDAKGTKEDVGGALGGWGAAPHQGVLQDHLKRTPIGDANAMLKQGEGGCIAISPVKFGDTSATCPD